ncbi:unnamed protein product, partial [Candidula unifasciata]
MLRLLLVLVLTATSVLAGCGQGWPQFEDFCFIFSEASASWQDALAVCNTYGGRLVNDDSSEKHEWIVEQLRAQKMTKAWIGGSKSSSGVWQWVPGEEPLSFTNWAPGEPNY